MKKTVLFMGILSWIFGACDYGVPKEKDYYGNDLPIASADNIWAHYTPLRKGQMTWVTQGSVQYIPQDNFTNPKIYTLDGIGAIDSVSNRLLWHALFPEKQLVSKFNKNDSSYIGSEIIVLVGKHVLCTYKHYVPPQQNNDKVEGSNFWKFMILDSQTGEILKNGGTNKSDREVEYVFMGDNWFVRDYSTQKISKLNPETGETIWTHNQILRDFASLNANTVSFFNDNLDDTWQITVLDWATGKPIFEKKLNHFAKHRITNVLCKNDTVYVDMGAAYELNPLGAISAKYQDYTVAFDLKTTKPLWRTGFVKN